MVSQSHCHLPHLHATVISVSVIRLPVIKFGIFLGGLAAESNNMEYHSVIPSMLKQMARRPIANFFSF